MMGKILNCINKLFQVINYGKTSIQHVTKFWNFDGIKSKCNFEHFPSAAISKNFVNDYRKINEVINLKMHNVLSMCRAIMLQSWQLKKHNKNQKALSEFKPLPRIFTFYSWLSAGNKKSFKNSRIQITILNPEILD